MSSMDIRADQSREYDSWLALGRMGLTVTSLLTKARNAKDSNDLLDHADVIVGVAALAVAAVRWRRERRNLRTH